MRDALIEELVGVWQVKAEFETDRGRREMLRECTDTLRMLLEACKPPKEEQQGDTPCPVCNANGAFKYGPDEGCICQGRAWIWKLA